ncbi:hypothetical protein [Edaphobacter bradus]|uniref:hypothetical protein n=1 Tax=Edaphobacter bradus TaxID=2259016 RepID=UPI0021DF5CFF|nr:hypothetical protein [Edaphobacter bradus]
MAATSLFTCVCGVQKKTSNHWVLARVTPFGIEFMPWDAALARNEEIVVLCGEGCAAALLSRCMGEWKNFPPAKPVKTAIERELAAA